MHSARATERDAEQELTSLNLQRSGSPSPPQQQPQPSAEPEDDDEEQTLLLQQELRQALGPSDDAIATASDASNAAASGCSPRLSPSARPTRVSVDSSPSSNSSAAKTASAPVSRFFRWACAAALVVQNVSVNIGLRHSRGVRKEQYSVSHAVVLMELVKLLVSLLMLLLGFKVASAVPLRSLPSHVASLCGSRGMLLMGVPGLLYFIMNQLVFVGLQNLDAATFSLMSQTKLITTAIFARLLVNKRLHWYQHRALLLLLLGVLLVQDSSNPHATPAQAPASSTLAGLGSTLALPAGMVCFNATASEVATAAAAAAAAGGELSSAAGAISAWPQPSAASVNVQPSPLSVNSSAVALPSGSRRRLAALALAAAPPAPSPAPTPSQSQSQSQASSSASTPAAATAATASDSSSKPIQNRWLGITATLMVAVLSGFSGAYVERALKSSATLNVWDRNVQLAVWGALFGALQLSLSTLPPAVAVLAQRATFGAWFAGYSMLTVGVLALAVLGGILVSLVLAYLDNIVRCFATSIALVFTSLLSLLVWHEIELTIAFACGLAAVVIAVVNYAEAPHASDSDTKPAAASPGPGADRK